MSSGASSIPLDELDHDQMPSTSFGEAMGAFTRRSIRQIGTLRNRLFRLPATPRLSRSNRKVLVGKGEEPTGWNFARANPESGRLYSPPGLESPPITPRLPRQKAIPNRPMRISTVNERNFPPDIYRGVDDEQFGGSCRLPSGIYSRAKNRLPIPAFDPPPATEAKNTIHSHLRSLLPSPPPLIPPTHQSTAGQRERRNFHLLPDTSYDHAGEVTSACWRNDRQRIGDEEPKSPTQSSITLLNTQSRVALRSMSTSSASMRNRRSRASYRSSRPFYPLNGLFHQPSLLPVTATPGTNGQISANGLELPPLLLPFNTAEFEREADPFLGREWLFKELYKTVLSEQSPLTALLGESGCGKSSVLDQLVLHSAFCSREASNANTVDSGIVVDNGVNGRRSSLDTSAFTSINYEWLKILSSRVAAFHKCHLYSSISCSIPEFVRSIAICLCHSPLTKDFYSRHVLGDENLRQLILDDEASLGVEPLELFRLLVLRPLRLYESSISTEKAGGDHKHRESSSNGQDEGALIILVDAVDEASFHRNDGGESIGWLISKTTGEHPSCLRFIVTAVNTGWKCDNGGANVRTIRLDDVELDERVARDSRIYIDYHLAIKTALEQKIGARRENAIEDEEDPIVEFVEEIMGKTRGNHLFISLLLRMIEEDKIRIRSTSLNLLPASIQQLYLLCFNTSFTSLSLFNNVSSILAVILASLRPLKFDELLEVLNSPSPYSQRPLVTERELERRLGILPMIKRLPSGHYVPFHQSFREWLMKESSDTEYFVDIRYGHILLAVALVRRGDLGPEDLFELGHHLLKANPHKYMNPSLAADLPLHKNAQVAWIQIAAGEKIEDGLLYNRNTFTPNIKVSRLLLTAGADANTVWPEGGESLLGSFARAGNCDMITLLVQHGAIVDYASPKSGRTPLLIAVEENKADAAKTLISCGASQWREDSEGKNAIVYAARHGSTELLACMLERCEDGSDGQGSQRATSIESAFSAAVKSGNVEICRYILDCTQHTIDISSAMCSACTNGHTDLVQFLLSRGATLSTSEVPGSESPLICAVQSGSWDLVVNVLRSSLATDVNYYSLQDDGETALMLAASRGHVGLVDLLVANGADVDIRDRKGRTAIMHAISGTHFSSASLLIEKGCELKLRDSCGDTLLHYLAGMPNKQLIGDLIESGLSLEEKNNEDLRPIEVAIQKRNYLALEIFLRHGARLRSLTWQMARSTEPDLLLTLIKKLLDDASILLRRKKPVEALHRLNYSLQKCCELLEKCQEEDGNECTEELPPLKSIEDQLRMYKLQTLLSIAYMKRRNRDLQEAIKLTDEAMPLVTPGDDGSRFELHLFRAKCFFDAQDIHMARAETTQAYSILPANIDVQNLLMVLDSSCQISADR